METIVCNPHWPNEFILSQQLCEARWQPYDCKIGLVWLALNPIILYQFSTRNKGIQALSVRRPTDCFEISIYIYIDHWWYSIGRFTAMDLSLFFLKVWSHLQTKQPDYRKNFCSSRLNTDIRMTILLVGGFKPWIHLIPHSPTHCPWLKLNKIWLRNR